MIRYGVPDAEYRAIPAMSHSELKRFGQSPGHLKADRAPNRVPKPPSPQMLAGTRMHCATLEPDEFDKRYIVPPPDIAELNKNTKLYKDWVATHASAGEIIDPKDRTIAFAKAESLKALHDIGKLLRQPCETEVVCLWTDPDTGVRCKAKIDIVKPFPDLGGVILGDLKGTDDARRAHFRRSIGAFGYHTQAAHYSRGFELASAEAGTPLQVLGFVFGVVEHDYPYAAAPYMLSDAAMATGHRINAERLGRYAECVRTDTWPTYHTESEILDLMPYHEMEEA